MNKNKYGSRRWAGYTLEELRNQRTLVNARIMIERHRLSCDVNDLRESVVAKSKPVTIAGRMFSALSYLDWVVMGVTAIRKISPLFRRHRR